MTYFPSPIKQSLQSICNEIIYHHHNGGLDRQKRAELGGKFNLKTTISNMHGQDIPYTLSNEERELYITAQTYLGVKPQRHKKETSGVYHSNKHHHFTRKRNRNFRTI